MRRSKLDAIDKKILQNLQADGRMTNVELAKVVGISAPPCLRRVRALEDAGYIHSYHAQIDPAILGYSVTVFAMVRLESQAEKDLEAFEKHMVELPMVRECHMLAGDVDFILKIVAKDWDSYQEFLTHELTTAPNVISVKSSLNIRSAKDEAGVPIEQ
ncbi:MAG: Lrp/AsnC family transcriptional regulator [Rhodospirillales bacterium]|nr:Lrp/AsnC family transcriptional regulator [Alphaproteobacteria bacterium]MCB9981828.1 Lrp/AsnC family transcriptional regulator [Rhodospirillales bacterium]